MCVVGVCVRVEGSWGRGEKGGEGGGVVSRFVPSSRAPCSPVVPAAAAVGIKQGGSNFSRVHVCVCVFFSSLLQFGFVSKTRPVLKKGADQQTFSINTISEYCIIYLMLKNYNYHRKSLALRFNLTVRKPWRQVHDQQRQRVLRLLSLYVHLGDSTLKV